MAVLPPDPVFNLRHPDIGSVHCVCFHQNTRLLAGTAKGRIYLWDLQTNRTTLNFEVGQEAIVNLHHTTNILIVQEKNGKISFWEMTNAGYKRKSSIATKHFGFCRMDMLGDLKNSNNEQLLFFAYDATTVGVTRLCDTNDPPQLLMPEDPHIPKLGNVMCLKSFEYASQKFLLVGYESGNFLTWDLSTGVVVDLLQLDPEPLCLDYDACSNRGLIGGSSDKITIFSYRRQSMQMERRLVIKIKNPGINCVRIRHDKKIFALSCWDGRIRIFSWKSLRPLAVLTEHKTGSIMDIAYSDDKISLWNSSIMAAAGSDGQITLWDLYN